MRTRIIAVLLCALSAAAVAQTTPKPTPHPTPSSPTAARQSAASATERPTGELIKTAGAATHERPAMRQADGRTRGNGKAMLFTTLAVMCGIALRRFASQGK